MKLAVGPYELGEKLSKKLGCASDSTLILRALFFLGVLLINPSATQVLLEIATHFTKDLPSFVNDPEGFARATKKVRRESQNWCLQNNLKEPWCTELALLFVCMARWFTESGDSRAGMLARAFPSETSRNIELAKEKRRLLLNDRPISLKFEPWLPHFEDRLEYRAKIVEAVMTQIDQLCDARAEEAQKAGFTLSRERREMDVYFWTAAFQVFGLSFYAIAKAENADRPTVMRAIKKPASEMGLELRSMDKRDNDQSVESIRLVLRAASAPLQDKENKFDLYEHIPSELSSIIPRGLRDIFA